VYAAKLSRIFRLGCALGHHHGDILSNRDASREEKC
jgi:hypothetical protein